MWNRLAATAFAAVVFLVASAATAEAPPAAERPKIGLVLGGGGARGIAHIGVLKVMETLRVPVDYIAGTSMGSIVGGVYAAGVRPADMERKVLGIDWGDVFDDRPPRASQSLRRKDDDRTPLFRLELGFRDGKIQLPTGAVRGRKLNSLLQSLTASASGVRAFDKLPIPFRAVATDLESGEMMVFDKGYLTEAMRASMSVPGAFDPVDIDGRILVDGGLVRNVPIDIVRDMGAEVVIAVDVGAIYRTRKQLDSLPAVLDQMMNISIRKNADEQLATLKAGDIKIIPDLGNIGALDFLRGAEAIAAGERAARAVAEALAQYSLSEAAYQQWMAQRAATPAKQQFVDFVDIVGLERVNPEVVIASMETKPGKPLDPETLSADLERLYARRDFDAIDFRAAEDARGEGLRIKFLEKPWGPNFVQLGLNLSTDFQGDSYFNLLGRYTRTWINDLGGELRAEGSIGRTRRLYGELYQPVNVQGTLYVRPYAGLEATTQNFFAGEQPVARYDIKASYAGFAVGTQIFKWADVSAGLRYAKSTASPIIGSPLLPEFAVPYGGITFRAIYDQLDNYYFPSQGTMAWLDALVARSWLGSEEQTTTVRFNGMTAFTVGPHVFNVALEAGKVFEASSVTLANLTLGGLFRLSGLQNDQLLGEQLLLGRVIYSYRVAQLPSILGGPLYVGASAEAGNVWPFDAKRSLADLLYAGSVYFGADTFAGPFYLAYGHAESGQHAFYMYLGRPF